MPKRSLCPQSTPSSSPRSPSHQPPKRRRAISPSSFIAHINSLSLPAFQSHYLTPFNPALTFTPPSTASHPSPHLYVLTLHDSRTIPPADLNACFKLVELTSRAAYQGSSIGWSARKKKAEMREEGMKFLVVRRSLRSRHQKDPEVRRHGLRTADHSLDESTYSHLRDRPQEERDSILNSGTLDAPGDSITPSSSDAEEWEDEAGSTSPTSPDHAPIEAFLSFLPTLSTYGQTAIYCYEIHLLPHLRGCGLGRHLMHVFETIGRSIGVEKAMLTVFAGNVEALTFYGRLGYDVDEESPRVRKLRGGRVKRADYLILSKSIL